MADRYAFQGIRRLVDVTVTQVPAGGTHTTAITGSKSDTTGKSNITTVGGAPVMSTAALSGDLGDLTDLILVGSVDSTGTFPDVTIQPFVDGQAQGDKITIDGSAYGNMMPGPAQAVGMAHISLGIAFRKALRARMASLPTKATGLKAKAQYQFQVSSVHGWGNAANAQSALRMIGIGDRLDTSTADAVGAELQAMLDDYAAGTSPYNPLAIYDKAPGFAALSATFGLPAGLTSKTWTSLPGGNDQKGIEVWRFLRHAYNTVATSSGGIFPLSGVPEVGGVNGYVLDSNHDLGFNYENSTDYLRFLEFGNRPGANQAYVGVKVNDTVLPDSPFGFAITDGVNPWPYGNVQPQRTESGVYYVMGKNPWPVVARKNRVVWFVVADGTAIPAQYNGTTLQDCAGLALGGILVKGV